MSSPSHVAAPRASPPDRRALSWWRALCILAGANVCLRLIAWYASRGANAYTNWHLALSGVYVLVCACRSVLPRVDLERLVLVNSFLSSIFLGRVAATVAEICFAIQLGLLIHQLGAGGSTGCAASCLGHSTVHGAGSGFLLAQRADAQAHHAGRGVTAVGHGCF